VTDIDTGNGDEGADALIGIERAAFADANLGFPVYSEFRVNSTTVGSQASPTVAGLADGGYVLAWHSDGQDGSFNGIYAQRYDALGLAIGGETMANSTTADDQAFPSVAALTNGGYVVVWQSWIQDGSTYGIYAQRFDATGVAVGSETRVNTTTAENQLGPSVTALTNGGYVVTWSSNLQDGNSYGIYAQRYDSAGTAVGPETRVNTTTLDEQSQVVAHALSSGGYVVVWQSLGQDGSGDGIYIQRYNAAGAAVGSESRANTTTDGYQSLPSVASLSDGGYVVSWHSSNQDGSGYGIYAQRYDADGSGVGAEARVNTYTSGEQNNPSVAGLSGGGYVVTWMSAGQDGSGDGVYVQRYGADGTMVGAETRANTYNTLDQRSPSVAGLADGGYIIAWQSLWQDGGGYGIYAQRYDSAGNVVGIVGDVGANIFAWSGSTNVSLDGASGNDTLTGGSGNDDIDGGSGADSMIGGAGDDLYLVDDIGDSITESASAGTDTVRSSAASFTISANVENLVLAGTGNINGTGSSDANTLSGNSGNNQIDGAAGNDTLYGGGGTDQFAGGAGNDLIYVDSADDTVSENSAEGSDTVSASISYTLTDADVENLILMGSATVGAGNTAANQITGNANANTLTGGGGNDTIDGGAGSDTGNYSGAMAGYRFGLNGSGQLTITDTDPANGNEGSDTLISIEQAAFADGTLSLKSVGETRVNTTTAGDQRYPVITAMSDGGYVLAWQSSGQDGTWNIYVQRYDAAGGVVGGETLVNTTTTSQQYDPSIATLADGGYLVTWAGYGPGEDSGIFARRYNAAGVAVGGETLINSTTATTQMWPLVAALNDGGYVITWQSSHSGYGIYAQRYDAAGVAVGGETHVDTTPAAASWPPHAITALADGGYVVAWWSTALDGDAGSSGGVYAQRFNAANQAVGGEVHINTTTLSNQYDPAIAGLSDGGYVVTWATFGQDGSEYGLYAQRFDAAGAPVGGETRVNTTTASVVLHSV
jgi:Ca2+-binding RTX toxin-like protein